MCSVSDLQNQNALLNKFINTNDVDFTKTQYLVEQNRMINSVNFLMICLYFGMLIIYAYLLVIGKMSLYMKIGLISVFVLYPFVITKIEFALMKITKYLYDTMVGNVYADF